MPKFGAQIDTQGIPIKGLRPEQSTTFPASPSEGQMIHRTDQNKVYQYLAGAWQQIAPAGAPLTHTHPWADITDKPTTFPPSAHNHDAGAITFSGGLHLPSDFVEGTLNELAQRNLTTQSSIDAHTNTSTAAHQATAIHTTPAGGLSATNVQAALNELDSEKATMAQVTSAINALVDGAPGAIDTLNELAAALGDDPNFATTVTNALGQKAALNHTHNLANADIIGTLPLSKGGTGSTTASSARIALGVAGSYTASSPALTAGTWSSNINHGLGADFLDVSFSEVSSGENIELDWRRVDANQIQVRADLAFAASALRVLVTAR